MKKPKTRVSRELPRIESEAINYLNNYTLWVLRDSKGVALDVSYSKDGLKWSDRAGKLKWVKKGYISNGERIIIDGTRVGTMEVFRPRNHNWNRAQAAEFAAIQKAYRLLYTPSRYDGLTRTTGRTTVESQDKYHSYENGTVVYSTDRDSSPRPSGE